MPKPKHRRPDKVVSRGDRRNSRSTVSGPASPRPVAVRRPMIWRPKLAGTQELAASIPFNANKPLEYDPAAAVAPAAGSVGRAATIRSSARAP